MVTANYSSYAVAPEVQDRLRGRDGKVEVCWWEQEDNERELPKVYLYQDDVYLGECPRVVPYKVSKLEQKEADRALFVEQRQRLTDWDKAVAERQPEGVVMIDREVSEAIELKAVQTVAIPLDDDTCEFESEYYRAPATDYASRGVADL